LTPEELQVLIEKLAEAKCPDHNWSYTGVHQPCNGTGFHPLTALLRVKCDYWAHKHIEDKPCYSEGMCTEHRAECPGWGSATPAEAEAVGLKLFMVYVNHIKAEADVMELRILDRLGTAIRDGDPLIAILKAMEQAIETEAVA